MTQQWKNPPDMQIDTEKDYSAILHTSMGDITFEFFTKDAPKTVNNFIFLAKNGFYNGIKFHRVVKNFMIQTGDPLGNGTGGPGYRFDDELPTKRSYDIGIVAMANAGPNTNGSQFFICSGPDALYLDRNPNYTQFAKVTDGLTTVLNISTSQTRYNPMSGEYSILVKDVLIDSVDIIEK